MSPAPSRGINASSGMTARSWNSRMANDERPCRAVSWPFSARICSTNAVDDIARPSPITTALWTVIPNANAIVPSAAPVIRTWAVPSPNTERRSTHSLEGCSSRPMTNSSSATPSSAKCRIFSTSVTNFRHQGPMMTPAARYPSTAPSRNRRNSGTATTAAARKTAVSASNVMVPGKRFWNSTAVRSPACAQPS